MPRRRGGRTSGWRASAAVLPVVVLAVTMLASTAGPVAAQGGDGSGGSSAPARATASVDPEVEAAVGDGGDARVIVRLRDDGTAGVGTEAVADNQARVGAVLADLPDGSFTEHRRLRGQPVAALTVDAPALEALRHDPSVAEVVTDGLNTADLAQSTVTIGATNAWSGGTTGAGQTVVILDTGVESSHPFLGGKVIDGACYSSPWPDFSATAVCPGADPEEAHGLAAGEPCPVVGECDHGTHVAGIAAGGTGASGSGVAWGADIISIQVFSRFDHSGLCNGSPPCVLSFDSDMIAALDLVDTDLRFSHDISSVNLSIGGGVFTSACDTKPHKPVIDSLKAHGIATVISSGNDSAKNGISSPACISSAVSVGATTDVTDVVASFSNSSADLDLLAPGVSITSSVPGAGFGTWNGTSMAAPHVTGAWALLRQANPGVTVADALSALKSTGVGIIDTNGLTKPRIQVDAAAAAVVGPPPAPSVTGLSPDRGAPAGGYTIAIQGLNFSGATAVKFGPFASSPSFTIDSSSQITATVPPGNPGQKVTVKVTTPSGTSAAVSSALFTYAPPPTVNLATPNASRIDGGTTVAIRGKDFTGTTSVTFLGVPAASFTVISDYRIDAVTPARAPGFGYVEVTTPYGTSAQKPSALFRFTDPAPPDVTGLSPNSGPTVGGNVVVLTGTGFTGATQVRFNLDTPAPSFTVDSDTQLTVLVPPHAAGYVNVVVTTPVASSGNKLTSWYRYT